MKKKIYFADLTNYSSVISQDVIPLGCGYVASYTDSLFGREFDISIYKNAELLLEDMQKTPPDIFAGSCYVWNKNLVLLTSRIIKERYPHCLVVLGGPAFPLELKRQKAFLENNREVDFFIPYDGEIAFTKLLEPYLALGKEIFSKGMKIDGCTYLGPGGDMLIGKDINRPKALDVFPSPYLTGLFDKFLEDKKFSPIIQSTRGCPFRCSYCWASNGQNRSCIGFFSADRVKEELYYIANKAVKTGTFNLLICDSNFGLYPKDMDTVEMVYDLQQSLDWPKLFKAYYGKGNRAQLVKSLAKLKGVTYCFSTQSTNTKVLDNIKRPLSDITRLTEYVGAVHDLKKRVVTEIITGMPYETRQTHMQTLRDLLDYGFDYIEPFTLMLLDGTELDSEKAHKKFKYDIRYRLIPRNFGKIDGRHSFEIEKVVVGTNTYDYDDYIYFRSFHGLLRLVLNNNIYKELLEYIKQYKAHPIDWLAYVFEDLKHNPSVAADRFKEYVDEAHSELWDSPQALMDYFSSEENYKKLLTGERGNNLMQKCTINGAVVYFNDYVNYFFDKATDHLQKRYPERKEDIALELDDIRKFTSGKLSGIFKIKNLQRSLTFDIRHDLIHWRSEGFSRPIFDYKLPGPKAFTLELTDEQVKLVDCIVKRYNVKEGNFSGLYKASGIIDVTNYFRRPKISGQTPTKEYIEVEYEA